MATETGGGFRLTPQEDFVHGVSLVGTSLRFIASGTQLIEAWLTIILGIPLAVGLVAASYAGRATVNGVEVARPEGAAAVGALILVAIVAYATARMRSGVTATPDGLTLRRTFRRRELIWSEIEDLQAVETSPERWAAFLGGGGVALRAQPVGSWSLGLVVLQSGTAVPLPAFVSASRGEGLSLGGQTPTELKVEALRRYREELVDAWPPNPGAPTKVESATTAWSIAFDLAWPLVLWLALSWAAGTLVAPLLPLMAYVGIFYQRWRIRRRDPLAITR